MNSTFRSKLRNRIFSAAVTAGLALGLGFLAAPTSARAVYCSNCARWHQQMYEYVEAVNTQVNTASQLATQMRQYQNMIMQGAILQDTMFGRIGADLQGVASIYTNSQALGRQIQNMDSRFNAQFPGFQGYMNSAASRRASSTMPDRYERWAEQGRDNVRVALESANQNTSSFDPEEVQLTRMMARSQSAAGRMQAIQVGNEIASANVQQLQKLRDLLATQINMQANYLAEAQDRTQLDDAVNQQRRSGVITQTGNNKGY